MSKYKVGDKVVVKKELKKDKKYYMENSESYWYEIDEEMKEYESQVVTINYVCEKFYEIEEDYGDWVWTDEMFKGLASEVNKNNKEENKSDQIAVDKIPSNIIHKSNLHTGDIVVDKDGDVKIVMLNTKEFGDLLLSLNGAYSELKNYNDNLTHKIYNNLSIADIRRSKNIWNLFKGIKVDKCEYESILTPTKKMTLEEMIAEVEKLHGCKVEIVDNNVNNK